MLALSYLGHALPSACYPTHPRHCVIWDTKQQMLARRRRGAGRQSSQATKHDG